MSAKADIWMPLYIGDYLRDTTRLTTAQHGAYLLLIMDYWTNGAPPDDDEVLASITKSNPEEWAKLRAAIASKFQIEDGVWRHSRIDQELEEAKENKQKRLERSLKANLAKAAKATSKDTYKDALEDTVEVTPSPSPSPSSSTKKRERGSRLSPDTELTPEWEAFCRQDRPDLDPQTTFAKFKDFWVSKAGQGANKLDWTATWRNWVRNEKSQPNTQGLSKGAQTMAALTRGLTLPRHQPAGFWEKPAAETVEIVDVQRKRLL